MADTTTETQDVWLRQTRRLETACSIIQEIHGDLSLERVIEGIVESFVEVGGFAGAEIQIDATIETLKLHHVAKSGVASSNAALTRVTPIFIRGFEIGAITAHYHSADVLEEHSELLEFVLPTLFMGIDHAVSFAEVLDYRATLENKVAERTAQLAEAHQQLSQTVVDLREAQSARDRFFANINHEIRTPLTLIQLAADDIGRSPLADSMRGKLGDINAATRRLLGLVNSLLQLAAGHEGRLHLRPRALDAAESLQRIVADWTSAAARGELELSYDGPDECPASLDEGALETIVGNLISNAVKFTPPRGRVAVSLRATAETLAIRVRDTGPGIDPDFLPKLFGRFERSTTAIETGVRGSGIGLSLSKELVDLQRGTIQVVRNEGKGGGERAGGTTFEMTVPRYQATSAITPNETVRPTIVAPLPGPAPIVDPIVPRAVGQSRAEATILIAEDDLAIARHIASILSEKYIVLVASNGKEALELASKHRPDMLVTDLEMPEMDGLELTRQFLKIGGTSLSPVLIVSAHAALSERLASFDAGAVDYVLKPFSAAELLARIRSQLAMRKLALKLHETETLAAMGMLSAGLAHELRNPANAVVNALEPLWSLLPEEERQPESSGALLHEVLMTAASHMRDLCTNILSFSRSGAVVKHPEDLRGLLRRVRLVLKAVLVDVELVEDVDVEGPVHCAGALIEQVLVNLLQNATHAAGRGGRIELVARRERDRVIIEVGDSGPGVPVHLHERIFDPFFTTKPIGEGTGLGLSVSRRIASNHGGELRVVRHGETSRFRLELPQPSGSGRR